MFLMSEVPSYFRSRAKREQLDRYQGLLPESQGKNLAVTFLYVPCSLDSGRVENTGSILFSITLEPRVESYTSP